MRISDWSSDVCSSDLLVEVDVDEPISRDHPPATHVGVLLATNDEIRRTAINNARMQNPQNALDHPLSSLSIQWQERHDRLPPRVVDQLEFSPRGGDLPDLAARNRAAVQQPRRQVVFASVALVSAVAPRPAEIGRAPV